MKQENRQLADWAIQKIEAEYKDDVCLLLEHRTLRLDKDQKETYFSFYIPATSRSNGLARTFIIEGIGHDLFPISWERIERMADVKEYNTTCLADAEILYARSEDDRQRFESLRAKLYANLQNPYYMYSRALEWENTATEVYQDMLFETRLYKVREGAGYICDLLSIAIAFVNGRYFKHGQTNQINELLDMKKIPENFAELYKRIIFTPCADEQKSLCHEILLCVKAFLATYDPSGAKPASRPDFSELAAWYQELCYTWRRVYHWCGENDPVNAYIWCCYLQTEVERMGTACRIEDVDLLSAFDPKDLPALRKRAEIIEEKFIEAIKANGIVIESYQSIEDFLRNNS